MYLTKCLQTITNINARKIEDKVTINIILDIVQADINLLVRNTQVQIRANIIQIRSILVLIEKEAQEIVFIRIIIIMITNLISILEIKIKVQDLEDYHKEKVKVQVDIRDNSNKVTIKNEYLFLN